jgi:hypothetical protein
VRLTRVFAIKVNSKTMKKIIRFLQFTGKLFLCRIKLNVARKQVVKIDVPLAIGKLFYLLLIEKQISLANTRKK